jgi:hypothetical protein
VIQQNGLLNVSQGPAARVEPAFTAWPLFFPVIGFCTAEGSFVTPVATAFRVAVGVERARKRANAVVRQSDMGLHDLPLNVRMSAC